MTALDQLKKLSESLPPVWHGQRALKAAIVELAGSFTHDQYHAGCDAIRNERNRAQDENERLRAEISALLTQNTEVREQCVALRAALREVGGSWRAFEFELRQAIGNTNYAVVAEKIAAVQQEGKTK
jgi:septal ring factor EnvC (AmiA/AmiB activator)